MLDFILSMVSESRPDKIVLSSVRNFSIQNIETLRGICDRLIILDDQIKDSYGIPGYLTPDRAASIIASRYLFKGRKCMIFDFGTSLAIDFLDADGRYEGGNVSPGCRTRFKAINRYSRQFPLLDTPEETEEKGHDIESSIESGVISGMVFEIEGRICQNPENIVVFTGGDANYFAKRMKNSIFVVCNLVLMGLALTAVEYCKNE